MKLTDEYSNVSAYYIWLVCKNQYINSSEFNVCCVKKWDIRKLNISFQNDKCWKSNLLYPDRKTCVILFYVIIKMTLSMIFVYIATIDFLLLTKYLNLHNHDLVPVVLDKKVFSFIKEKVLFSFDMCFYSNQGNEKTFNM